jgi:hypothetical protein
VRVIAAADPESAVRTTVRRSRRVGSLQTLVMSGKRQLAVRRMAPTAMIASEDGIRHA